MNVIKLKRCADASNLPPLEDGEVAYCTGNGKIYYGTVNDGNILLNRDEVYWSEDGVFPSNPEVGDLCIQKDSECYVFDGNGWVNVVDNHAGSYSQHGKTIGMLSILPYTPIQGREHYALDIDVVFFGFGSEIGWKFQRLESSKRIKTISVSDSVSIYDKYILCNAESGNVIVSLPNPTLCSGCDYTIKKIDSSQYVVIVKPSGSSLIDGEIQFTVIDKNESITVVSNGSNWYVV